MTTRTSATAAACVVVGAAAGAGWAALRRQRRPGAVAPAHGRVGGTRHSGSISGKAAAVATLTSEWVRDTTARLFGWPNGDEAEDAITKDVTNELAQILATYGERRLNVPAPGAAGPERHLVAQASSR